jgi:peptidoglycan/LPS O-acetylase OafA/YrhL
MFSFTSKAIEAQTLERSGGLIVHPPVYRPDVDGLRAIAVLAVIGFHVFPTKVTGGFVGVDIFFVISGFLITGILLSDLARNSFSFAGFYARRVRRIFPALAVMLVACVVAGWLVLFPNDYQQLGKHIAAGAAFVANLVALHEAGYFDTSGAFKPLLHLWSLGVEEQFYLIWPPLLLMSWRWRNGPLVCASIVLVLSLFANLALSPIDQPTAFYLPITRFWELMAGALVAIAQSRNLSLGKEVWAGTREGLVACGMALILGSTLLLDEHRSFPGWWALFPTLGAALLILEGQSSVISKRVLGHPILVHIGLISYPLYLWHWPILVFVRTLHYEEPSRIERVLCIVAAFVLAELTFRYIEKPIRYGSRSLAKTAGVLLSVGLAGCLGLAVFVGAGMPDRFPAEIQRWTKDFQQEVARFEQAPCFLEPSQAPSKFASTCDGAAPTGTTRVLLWGDSHAAHLAPGLRQIENGAFDLAQFTASGCPPVFGFVTRRIPNCTAINEFVAGKIRELKPDLIIMAGRWDIYDGSDGVGRVDAAAVLATVGRLRELGANNIVAIGQFPVWRVPPQRILARAFRMSAAGVHVGDSIKRQRDASLLSLPSFARDDEIKQAFEQANVTFVSPKSTFCDASGCLLMVPGTQAEPESWDADGHLTQAGSIYFVAENASAILEALPHQERPSQRDRSLLVRDRRGQQ